MSKFLKKVAKILQRAKNDRSMAKKWLKVQRCAVGLFPERFRQSSETEYKPMADTICELLDELAASRTPPTGKPKTCNRLHVEDGVPYHCELPPYHGGELPHKAGTFLWTTDTSGASTKFTNRPRETFGEYMDKTSDGCGQVYTNGNSREQIGVICELPKGHEGSHLSGTFVWEGVLGQSNVGLNNLPVSYGRCAAAKESEPGHQRYCILQAGHGGTHRSSGTFSWEGWVDDSR